MFKGSVYCRRWRGMVSILLSMEPRLVSKRVSIANLSPHHSR